MSAGALCQNGERLLISDDITIPAHCRWALEKLYVPQRCGRGTCDASKRKLDNATVSVEMRAAGLHLLSVLPVPPRRQSGAERMRIVDIGAGLGMYHVFVARHYRGRTQHYIIDRSANGIRGQGRKSTHAGFHRSVLENGSFPFYSSLECARDIALCSGFTPERWHAVEASTGNVLSLGAASVDVVISLLSCTRGLRHTISRAQHHPGRKAASHTIMAAQCLTGTFHYPVSTYADAVRAVLKPDTGRLIVTPKAKMRQAKSVSKSVP